MAKAYVLICRNFDSKNNGMLVNSFKKKQNAINFIEDYYKNIQTDNTKEEIDTFINEAKTALVEDSYYFDNGFTNALIDWTLFETELK